jgi:hypothetical protein
VSKKQAILKNQPFAKQMKKKNSSICIANGQLQDFQQFLCNVRAEFAGKSATFPTTKRD